MNRQSDDYAAFTSVFLATKSKVKLNLIRWHMPQIPPNEQYKAMLLQHVKSGVEVDLAFMEKKIILIN